MSSGGGSNQPTNQTVTQTTIPEYARPYVERALGQAGALTDINQNPYQAYQGERFAQFTPLQQQAFQGAYQMQPSQQLTTATGLATGAGLGALGMVGQYNPYQTGQFTGSTAQQYMSPYMQNVVDIEKREAQRASDVAAQRDQAAFARAGAFGGARQAIVEAERARNLGTQMGDIQAKGSQAAYQQAADQFAREQQLREQSRQYGAGLGMQGLQTGLQAAGQLGQLGGQQFAQGMDINKLQQQYGMQQQQQMQNILNAQYQDYLNAKQYPYQQLGFMSDMLRGLPLSQSYSQTYQQPPSMLGQLAGLGMGAYSMFGKKDGGAVKSYAEGGVSDTVDYANHDEPVTFMAYGGSVTDESFVKGAIDRLSNKQLQQALQNALNRRDTRQAELIQAEIQERAESASFSRGLAGAAPSNMEDMLPSEEGMARGGIASVVSFSNGGDKGEPEEAPTPAGRFFERVGTGLSDIAKSFGEQNEISKLQNKVRSVYGPQSALLGLFMNQSDIERQRAKDIIRNLGTYSKDELKTLISEGPGAVRYPEVGSGRSVGTGGLTIEQMRELYASSPSPQAKAEPKPSGAPAKANKSAVAIGKAVAATTGEKPEDEIERAKKYLNWLREDDAPMYKAMQEQIDEVKAKSKEIGENKVRNALAEFGFAMAAAASQPGAGRGLAGALRSAAAASPTISRSVRETEEMQRKYDQLGKQMQVSMLQSKVAAGRGDKQAALGYTKMVEQMGLEREKLAANISYQNRYLGVLSSRGASGNTALQKAILQTKTGLAREASKQASKEWNDPFTGRNLRQQYPNREAYENELYKGMWGRAMPQLEYLGAMGEKSGEE